MSPSTMYTLYILLFMAVLLINSCHVGPFCDLCSNTLVAAAREKYKPASFVTYDFPSFGLQISIPSDWRMSTTPQFIDNIATFFTPLLASTDSYHENLAIAGRTYSSPISVGQSLDASLKSLERLNNVEVKETATDFMLGGYPAYRLAFSFKDNSTQFWAINVGIVSNSSSLTLIYRAQAGQYAEFIPVVEKILDSVVLTPINPNGQDQNRRSIEYKDSENNLTLKYPSNWIAAQQGFLSSVLTIYAPLDDISDQYYDNIKVHVNNVTSQNMTLSQLMKQREDYLKTLDDFKVISNGNTTVSGNPAGKLVYTFTANNGQDTHKAEIISSAVGNKSFDIFLETTPEKFDAYSPIMNEVVSSLSIKPQH
jgi:hypothetical protein